MAAVDVKTKFPTIFTQKTKAQYEWITFFICFKNVLYSRTNKCWINYSTVFSQNKNTATILMIMMIIWNCTMWRWCVAFTRSLARNVNEKGGGRRQQTNTHKHDDDDDVVGSGGVERGRATPLANRSFIPEWGPLYSFTIVTTNNNTRSTAGEVTSRPKRKPTTTRPFRI